MIVWLCTLYVCCLCIMAMMAMYHLCILAMYHGYVSWLCIMTMYHGYVSWLCIMASLIWLWIFCKRAPLICPQGPFGRNNLISCESKVACKFSKKKSQSALNHVLILQKDRTQKMLQIPLKIIDLQNDFNILVAKQWQIRISVPMSYIRFWE